MATLFISFAPTKNTLINMSKWPMVPMDSALRTVLDEASTAVRVVSVDLEKDPAILLGKVLAEDVVAAQPVPGFAASIMDG